ncbi:MAG: hypothetical protein RL124_309 [Acidobacteriota bacterium]
MRRESSLACIYIYIFHPTPYSGSVNSYSCVTLASQIYFNFEQFDNAIKVLICIDL